MKTEEIKDLFAKFESAASVLEGVECWSARQLQVLLGYSRWENFEKVIQKAKDACTQVGEKITDHFPDVIESLFLAKNLDVVQIGVDGRFHVFVP